MSLRITFGLFILNVICVVCEYYESDYVYTVPEPYIETFQPKGFRVSIPHRNGIELFAFHANINKELKDVDAGELSKDIIKKTGDKWIYENKNLRLKVGDTINYWLFVIKNHLGYKLDKQSFVVKKLVPVPDDFFMNSRPGPNKRPPYMPTLTTPKPKPSKPVEQPCSVCPVCPTASPSTTPAPITTTSSSIHTIVNIWSESLNNVTEEKQSLLQRVEELEALNEQLLKKLATLGHGNDTRLLMSGRLPPNLDPELFVETVLRDKLLLRDKIIHAHRNADNTIVFEMATFQGKLNVLRVVKDKLANSSFSIDDYVENDE